MNQKYSFTDTLSLTIPVKDKEPINLKLVSIKPGREHKCVSFPGFDASNIGIATQILGDARISVIITETLNTACQAAFTQDGKTEDVVKMLQSYFDPDSAAGKPKVVKRTLDVISKEITDINANLKSFKSLLCKATETKDESEVTKLTKIIDDLGANKAKLLAEFQTLASS